MTIKTILLCLAIAGMGLAACQPKAPETTVKGSPDVLDPLTYETAKRYVKNYEKHAGSVDSVAADGRLVKRPNSRAIWFPRKKLDSLLKAIEKENGDGIRFYLATYDENYKTEANGKLKSPKKDYWGYNTLVMVSTRLEGGIHKDYYTNGLTSGPAKGFIVGTTPENRGEMCPPPRDCTGTGATLIDTLKK